MANRDDHRGQGGDRWRRHEPQDLRGGRWGRSDEPRSFGEQGRYNSDQARYGDGWRGGRGEGEDQAWRRDRYGSRYDQDRTGYGSGYDRDSGGYGRGGQSGYGGQEYGLAAGGDRNRGEDLGYRSRGGDERHRDNRDAAYGAPDLNARGSGVEEFGMPHDYAYRAHNEQAVDPDYARWRDEQMRGHDRDYQEWRRHQQSRYDDDYNQFRAERRDTFGKNFHEWRSQRNTSTGMAQHNIGPESHDYGRRGGAGFGHGDGAPSGRLESPAAMTNSPSMTQNSGGGGASSSGAQDASQAVSGEAEFGKTPPQVQAAADGWDTRKDAEDRQEDKD
jgi:hypothetical protein